jgi:hypothetical protein
MLIVPMGCGLMVAEDASSGLKKYSKYFCLVCCSAISFNGPHSTGQHVLDTPRHQAIAAATMVSNRKGFTSAAVLHGAD